MAYHPFLFSGFNVKTRHFFKIITIITFFCIIISPTFMECATVQYNTLNFPASYSNLNLQTQSLTHQLGKFLFTYYDKTNNLLNISVWSSAGVYVSTKTQELSPKPVASMYIDRTRVIIYDHNTTHVIVAVAHPKTADAFFMSVYYFGVNTYAFTLCDQVNLDATNGLHTPSFINVVEYDNNPYFIFYSIGDASDQDERIFVIEVDTSTDTATVHIDEQIAVDTSSTITILPLLVQHPNQTNNIYIGITYADAPTQLEYWSLDLDTQLAEHLTSHPFADRVELIIYSHDIQIDGGVHINGQDTYLYFTWLHPYVDGTQQKVQNIQHRLRFNVTIEAGNFEAQNERLGTSYDLDMPADTRPCWAVAGNVSRTIIEYWQPHRYGTDPIEGWYIEREIHDWYNFALGDTTLLDSQDDNDTVPFFDDRDKIFRDGTSQFQINEDFGNVAYIIYGLASIVAYYDLTITWTPNENPLFQNKQYEYTISVFKNDMPYKPRVVSLEINEIFMWAKATDTNGVLSFFYTVGIAGIHEFEINIYDPDWVYYEEPNLTFLSVSGDVDPSTGMLLPTYIASVMQMIPLFVVVIIPCYTLGKVGGVGGYIMGLVIGVIIGIQASLLPPYTIYLVILTIALTFAYFMRGSGS